ncbi:hypothetical protein D6C83_07803, partial [Aureobasidium pullulans]
MPPAQVGAVDRDADRAETLARLIALLDQAASEKVQLLLYPEVTFTTFFPRHLFTSPSDLNAYFEHGDDLTTSPSTAPLFSKAKDYGIDIVVGFAERTDEGKGYNTCVYYSAAMGKVVQKYRKVHLPGTVEPFEDPEAVNQLEKRYFTPGDLGFPAFRAPGLLPTSSVLKANTSTLKGCITEKEDQGKGDPVLGMLICNDRRWPEAWRSYALQGAELLLIGYNTVAHSPHLWGTTKPMTRNGTSIHWHGIRQNHTNEMDGVVGVTQCALAPGQTMTYKWIAESYGFSWYHSHLTLQAYEGLFGPMYIDGPKSADFDVDAGHLIINDWSHIPVDDMYNDAQVAGVRTMDSGLINGMNINPLAKGDITGARYTVPTEFVPGKKYLFQLLNSAIQSTYKFYIDGHKFTVIAADFVPIEPYETTVLTINIGQRYEIIVEADQEVGDYFLRFDNQNACASTINSDDIRGIIHYAGGPGGTPNSTAYTYPRKDNGVGGILGTCEDEPLDKLVPIVKKTVSSPHQTIQHDVAVSNSNGINLYRWYLDGTTFQANWGDATLYNIVNNDTIPTASEIEVSMWRQTDDRKVWYEWQVEVFVTLPGGNRQRIAASELHSSIKNG